MRKLSGNINVTADPGTAAKVITIQLPGAPGPRGIQGVPGPSNILTIGTVSTGAPGSTAVATISGVSPAQTLNLTIPQGPVGATGPANTLAIGTVNTVAATTGASATITGTAPNQILNLVVPRGYGVIPAGTTGAVLTKLSNTDYDTAWSQPASAATASALVIRDANGRAQVADPSVAADIVTKNYSDTQATTTLNSARRVATNQQSSTAYTFVLTDEGKVVYYNADGSPVSYTIPLNSAVAFPIGSWIDIYQGANGTTTIVGQGGVVLRGPDGTSTVTLRALYSKVRITKSATDTWQVSGDIANVSTDLTSNAVSTAAVGTLVKRDINGRAQVADPSATQDIATKNYVDTNLASTGANAQQHPSAVWYSASTSNTANGQWWKIGTVTATAQYMDSTLGLLVTSVGTGAGNQQQARVAFRVKQQNAMASAPGISVVVQDIIADSTASWTAANFIAITETNTAGSTVVSLWVQNNQLYSNLYAYEEFQRSSASYGTFAYAASNAAGTVTSSLPAGAQTTGTAPLLGDTVALITQASTPANPPAGTGKLYLDGTNRATILGSSGSTRTAQYSWGAGTVFPTFGNMAGDTYLRTDIGTNGTVFQYTGNTSAGSAGWISEGQVVCTSTTHPTAGLYAGLQLFETDTEMQWTYNGTVWHLTGGRVPYVHVYRTAASPAFTYGTRTYCPFDTVATQDGGTLWTSANPTRVTIPVAGVYQLNGTYVMPQAAGRYFSIGYRVNGGAAPWNGFLRSASGVGNSVFYAEMTASGTYAFNAGDYIELFGEVDGSTTSNVTPVLDMVGTKSSNMRLEVAYLRPLAT